MTTFATLDAAFAGLDWLARQTDAFTTGTANNLALATATGTMIAAMQVAEASAETAIATANLSTPTDVLAAVNAAGNAAGCRAAVVELINLQGVLNRP